MRILIAPDKFKGSLTARQAAEAMAAGVRDALPSAKIDLCPLADGGEGTLDTIVTAANGRTDFHDVCGPLPGMRVNAPLGWIDHGKTAIVELAAASGLQLVPFERRDPTRTTTFGTGELISIAVRQGAKRVIVGIGGSATCDGGLGIAQACGAAIRLRSGKTYSSADRKITGADLGKVISIARRDGTPTESPRGILRFAGVEIVVAADVGNPLFGPDGAAHIFAPQKARPPPR
ncbi:MAG: glycerate kinase [Tepidisphaeraceae bacterium]